MNRSDLQKLAQARIREATILFDAGEFSGAYYLSGYAVECALKACFAKTVQRYDFPDRNRAGKVFIHRLPELASLAGVQAALESEARADPKFGGRWILVSQWNEESRYKIWSEIEAHKMINAVSDKKEGVFSWLKRRW